MEIGCAILAGGKSSRMGTDKALLEYHGKTFIEQIAGELSWFSERIIARGENQGFEEDVSCQWKVIRDRYPGHGPIGGLHAALSLCESEALFVVTCDMPFVKSDLARRLCSKMRESENRKAGGGSTEVEQADAVICVGADGRPHPLCAVYRKSVIPLLQEQIGSGQNRVMDAVKKMRVIYVPMDRPGQERELSNINTPQEYETMVKREKLSELSKNDYEKIKEIAVEM